uniref:Alpha-N-acetylglucosaminidase n=1 Tax=Cacopsylla melanoneura TaxID=428564 RepID=A0A8D8RYR7_9HEMI
MNFQNLHSSNYNYDLMLNESHPVNYSSNYNYDLVDITRQSLQVIFFQRFKILLDGFQTQNSIKFSAARDDMIQILRDLNEILGTEKKFLLGVWLNSAKSAASNVLESHIMEQNARNQITLWGPTGEIVDYANKQWSGVVSSYFLPRWTLFLDYLNTSLATNTSFDQNKYNTDVLNNVEKPFTYSLETYPDTPSGDSYQIAKKLYQYWIPKVSASQNLSPFATLS